MIGIAYVNEYVLSVEYHTTRAVLKVVLLLALQVAQLIELRGTRLVTNIATHMAKHTYT